ncbi:hypothetical protein KR018_004628, partial [Drosophila ironensis]
WSGMPRRCVICGVEPPEKDARGKEAYAFPKDADEAAIWQASMGAKGCCVESIQAQCCVCVPHIPEFVKRAKRIGRRLRNLEREKERKRNEGLGPGCQCPDGNEPGMDRPSVNVLLLNGASLPTYCGKGQSVIDLHQSPDEDGDSETRLKVVTPKESDTEIFVQESGFVDTGGTFPDIDGTELTVLPTPTQEDEQLETLQKELQHEAAESKEDSTNRVRRNVCMPGCTDVLLLGRGRHSTDECPCKCEQCSRPDKQPEEGKSCCNPPCCANSEPAYFTQPPCGCECERQVRRELGRVIKTQSQRIKELEEILCKQTNLRTNLQRRLDQLYCEFGRLGEDDKEIGECLKCAGPDCESAAQSQSQVSAPAPAPAPARARAPATHITAVPNPVPAAPPPSAPASVDRPSYKARHNHHHHHHHQLSRRQSHLQPREVVVTPEEDSSEEELAQDEGPERVHWVAARNDDYERDTRRPDWVSSQEPRNTAAGNRSQMSIRFGRAAYLVPER